MRHPVTAQCRISSENAVANPTSPLPASEGARKSIRPCHLEHGFGTNFKVVALAAGARDGARQRGLVDAVLDHGLVDVDGDDLAEGEPGLRLPAVGALQLND